MLVFVLLAAQAQAQQYRWVDDKGHVQYTDTPPPANAKSVEKKDFNAAKTDGGAVPYALQVARKSAPVKLYTSPDCEVCKEARGLLNRRGIPFSETSITTAEQLAGLKAISGGTSVPVMLVGAVLQKGFDENAYNGALDAAGYPKIGVLKPGHQPAPPAPKPSTPPKASAGPQVPKSAVTGSNNVR